MRVRMNVALAACASVLFLGACGSTTTPTASEATTAAAPETPRTGAPGEDTCGAAQYAGLVGSNIAAVTFPADANIRVIHPGDPVTQDMRPDRLNVLLDASGVIISLECY